MLRKIFKYQRAGSAECAYADLKACGVVRELFRLDDLKICVYGDMAIVFGLQTEKSKIHGKDMRGKYRFTDVFVKRDGRWQGLFAPHDPELTPSPNSDRLC